MYHNTLVSYVYVLIDPISLIVRYVGKSVDPSIRFRNHLKETILTQTNPYKFNWIQSLLKRDLKPILKTIECTKLSLIDDRERYWISLYRKLVGTKLTNILDGGEGGYSGDPSYGFRLGKSLQGHKSNKKVTSSSQFTGVVWSLVKQKWIATISVNKKQLLLATLDSEERCAYYYDSAALYYYGKKAKTNGIGTIPLNPIELRRQVSLEQKTNKRSQYLGITFNKNSWIVRAYIQGKRLEIARVKNQITAARLYDAVVRYHHEFPITNFEGITSWSIDNVKEIAKYLTSKRQSSPYTGVYFYKNQNKWKANVQIKAVNYSIGSFNTDKEAAIIADACTRYYFPHRNTNFPGDLKLSVEEARVFCRQKEKTSKYKGVSYCTTHRKFVTTLSHENKNIRILSSLNEKECAIAYDKHVLRYKLEKHLNFPENKELYLKEIAEEGEDGGYKKTVNRSKYFGICLDHNKWRAIVKRQHLGHYKTEQQAAKAVDLYLLQNKIPKPTNILEGTPYYEIYFNKETSEYEAYVGNTYIDNAKNTLYLMYKRNKYIEENKIDAQLNTYYRV